MSKSGLPDGGYVPTYGSNLMLDAFEFDSEYGEGPARARKDPDPDLPRSQNGLAALPDGFTGTDSDDDLEYTLLEAGDEGGVGDLSSLVKSASSGLVDLSWLEAAEQDPNRLPENPTEKMLGELVDAWGANRRTDGIRLMPNIEYAEPEPSHTAGLPGDPRPAKAIMPPRQKFRDIVAHAMRLSALGASLDRISVEVAALAGPSIREPKLASALRAVRAEHGAVGAVYLRDSAFPGLLTGKWDAAIKKRCASARYWLTTPGSKLSAYDRYLGKQVVTSVPWAEALDHYRPMLEAAGKRVASVDRGGVTPVEGAKIALLSALAAESIRSRKEANFPVQPATDEMSLREARKLFAETPSQVRSVVQKDATLSLKRKVEAQFAAWQKAGVLSNEDARKILSHKADPRDHLRAGAAIIATSKKQTRYEGQGVGVTEPERVNTRDASWASAQEAALVKAELDRAKSAVLALVKAGSLSQSDADAILASGSEPKEMVRLASLKVARVEGRKYEGQVFVTNQATKRASVEVDNTPTPVKKVLRWASVQMNEGMAGNDLDHLLRAKFAEDVLKQASEPLVQLRQKHEGLAGHVYVDASVYASPRGVTGCEQGALVHRANQIKALLQMERCGSCAANVEGSCQKYAKKLVTAAPVPNPARYQRETIRLANGTDADQVQAMFNAYDPGEFDLQNDNLDTLEYDDSPAPSYLNDVIFGGFDLSEEV